jgi:peptidoglycan/xylan/chitin deacetylase (PgdA/CDA1 family)
MSSREPPARRREREGESKLQLNRERAAALGSLIVVMAVLGILLLASTGGSGPGAVNQQAQAPGHSSSTPSSASRTTSQAASTTVPILVYHVINDPPAQSSADPALYVSADQFSSQMDALKAGGWHAVTLDQLEAFWTGTAALGPGKPIVLSFDNGYASHYTSAAPVLKRLGWVGVENLQVNGLPPSDGGLTDAEIRGLVSAGWELDTQGASHADLPTLDPAHLSYETATARSQLRSRYGAHVNWFSYPSGHYDATSVAAVRAAGFVGATTVVPGRASANQDRFRLPRLPVLRGTTAAQLLAQINSASANPSIPDSYNGPGVA